MVVDERVYRSRGRSQRLGKGQGHVETVEFGALKGLEFGTWKAPNFHIRKRICNFAFFPQFQIPKLHFR